MTTKRSHTVLFSLCVLIAAIATPHRVFAEDDAVDPPGRVARLSYLKGDVSLQPAGTEDWANATINRPLTTGDELWVDRDSRAELQVGSAVIHVDEGTGVSFLDLDDHAMQMRVTEGAVNVRIHGLAENETVEIDTPNAAISLLQPGEYRIDVDASADQTAVVVRDGMSEVTGEGEVFTVRRGERGIYTGTNRLAENIEGAGARDAFDAWANERDLRGERSVSARYVAPDVIGYEDLDEYGRWDSVPDYGYVWYPRSVVVGWSPYRYGHWAWVGPWGWTWIDDAPWGFAPFHYGRWAYVNTRWCWVPGPTRVRAVYAPALVGWVRSPRDGYNPNVGGRDRVGWFPLGPRDIYVPGHHVSERYIRVINTTNSRFVDDAHVRDTYRTPRRDYRDQWANRGAPNAITAVSQQTFVNAQPVSRHLLHDNEREFVRAPVSTANPNIAPGRSSVIGSGNAANVARPPRSQVEREVVVRRAPPPAPPTFAVQQRAIESNGGRVLPPSDYRRLREAGDREEANRTHVRSAMPGGLVRPTAPVVAPPAMRPAPGRAAEMPPPVSTPQSPPAAVERAPEPQRILPPDRIYRSEPDGRQQPPESRPPEPRMHENMPSPRSERVLPGRIPPPAPESRRPEVQQPAPVSPRERMYENRPSVQPRVVAPPPRPVEQPRPAERVAPPTMHAPAQPAAPAQPQPAPGGHMRDRDGDRHR